MATSGYIEANPDGTANLSSTFPYNGIQVTPKVYVDNRSSRFSTISIGASNAVNPGAYDYTCTGVNDHTVINAAINSLPINGGKINLSDGTFNISGSITIQKANVIIEGQGIDSTVINTSKTTIDGIIIGNTQVFPNIQLNNIHINDLTVNLPNASTRYGINATGMGVGGGMTNIKVGQGLYGFLLEDIDRCTFINIESFNTSGIGIVCRQGFNNTWGTVTFINCCSVLNTANTIGWQFDSDSISQPSPNKFDRVFLNTCHLYANPGVAGTVGVKFTVGVAAMTLCNCLWENTLRHNDFEAEFDGNFFACSFLNVNYISTPTTDIFYMNSYCQLSIYDCALQQSTNCFNAASGSPRIGIYGINKSGGNMTNLFAGSYGAKHGTDTEFAGSGILAAGINAQPYGYVFAQNIADVVTIQPVITKPGNITGAKTIDWSQQSYYRATLTGNVTFTFSNPTDGQEVWLILIQDGTGSRTVTWPGSVIWPAATAPTLTTTANHIDMIRFIYDSDASVYRGYYSNQLNYTS